MANNEERILVVKLGGRNCPVETNDNICLLGYDCENCKAGMTRSEAIRRMNCSISDYAGFIPAVAAKAALNALLEERR